MGGRSEAELFWSEDDDRIRVFLVDDQKVAVRALGHMLSGQPDIDFLSTTDSREAVAMAESFFPTVILQDLVMPDINGLQLLESYRQSAILKRIPVIILSATEDAQTKADTFSAGANDYLIKIPDRIELLARIRHHANAYRWHRQRDLALVALRESQRKLIESNQALNEKNEALAKFAHMVAHDLKNPLSSIQGYSEYLLDSYRDVMPEESNEILAKIGESSKNMASLVEKILSYSKAGAAELLLQPCRLTTLWADSRRQLEWQIESLSAEIVLEGDGEWICDRVLMVQVLVNLVSNALKYCPKERIPRIQLSLKSEGEACVLVVRDNGIGIPRDSYDKIFAEFERLDSGLAYGKGSGIGLSTVRKIVESHRGTIQVESELGQGSWFTIRLPAT